MVSYTSFNQQNSANTNLDYPCNSQNFYPFFFVLNYLLTLGTMFAKPYKHKSNNTLKNSEKKHLAQRVQEAFGLASEEKAKELMPMKGSCVCMKVVLNSGDCVNVYVVENTPVLVETESGLLPTVCALWKVPELVPVLDIHSVVLRKVQGGAPLYLPGVQLPAGGVGFPIFQIGTIIAARTEDNGAPCIVGRACMSSADMLLRAQGVCLDTLHFYGDQLCKDNKFSRIERPLLAPAKSTNQFVSFTNLTCNLQQLTMHPSQEEWPSLGKQEWPSLGKSNASAPVTNKPRLIAEPVPDAVEENVNVSADDTIMTDTSQVEDPIPTDMDLLLRWCLLSFLKLEGKSVELPLKTNLLYKNHLHPLCPADRSIDVKKSTFKKVGKFLEAMQLEGLVEVREIDRGVDALVAVNPAHPLVRSHQVPDAVKDQLDRIHNPVEESDYTPPAVREMLCVTANVHDIFSTHRKGTALTPTDVRNGVNEYVRNRNLTSTQKKGCVALDAALAKIVGKPEQEAVKWDVLMASVHGKMTPATEMHFTDGTVKLTKSRLEPVTMQVATRSGNKKVTLVSNLEQFGFSLPALAHACQIGVAATCGVTRSPGAKYDQLMLQGDQTYFIAKLLIEKYGLPKKFVDGAEKALNKKPK